MYTQTTSRLTITTSVLLLPKQVLVELLHVTVSTVTGRIAKLHCPLLCDSSFLHYAISSLAVTTHLRDELALKAVGMAFFA